MGRVKDVVVHEIREAIPPFVFFFAVFLLARVTKALTLEEYHLTAGSTAVTLVGALIVAKAILIADALPLTRLFERHALIYAIVWKTLIYYSITFVLHYLEEVIPFVRKAGGIAAGHHAMLAEVSWPHFAAVQLWVLFCVLLYCFAAELIGAVGADRVNALLFRERRP